jgi:hypothetical protein
MFTGQILGDTVIECPQSAGPYPSNGSGIIYIIQEVVVEHFPPDRYQSLFCNNSILGILELVDMFRLLSFSSHFLLGTVISSVCCTTCLLGTAKAGMIGLGHRDPFAIIIGMLECNRTNTAVQRGLLSTSSDEEETSNCLRRAFGKV